MGQLKRKRRGERGGAWKAEGRNSKVTASYADWTTHSNTFCTGMNAYWAPSPLTMTIASFASPFLLPLLRLLSIACLETYPLFPVPLAFPLLLSHPFVSFALEALTHWTLWPIPSVNTKMVRKLQPRPSDRTEALCTWRTYRFACISILFPRPRPGAAVAPVDWLAP